MKKILLFTTAIGFLFLALPSQAAIKCWTNKEGVRECGNTIPPEYAQQGSETINERGMTIETKERALTKEELEAKRKQEEEEARRTAEEEEQRKKQEMADRVLLSTFLSAEEVNTARDRQLSMIDANIEITNITIDKLKADLKQQRRKAANYERKGKNVPEATMKEIASLERQIKNKEDFITAKEGDKETIKQKYARDLERFLELKGQKSPR